MDCILLDKFKMDQAKAHIRNISKRLHASEISELICVAINGKIHVITLPFVMRVVKAL